MLKLNMNNLTFKVDQKVLDLGVKIKTAVIFGVDNQPSENVSNYIAQEVTKLSVPQINDILLGFREMHTKVGRSNKDYVSSPEMLINFLARKGRLPQINPVVDLYNLVSVKSQLALGAHDIPEIKGNVSLKITTGTEKFIPLGKTDPVSVPAEEYAYIDDGNNIICRLEVLQCDQTKITNVTKDVFLIIQGNERVSQDYVDSTAIEVCKLITKYCGGKFELLN